MYRIVSPDPLMIVLTYEGDNLKNHLQESKDSIYHNVARSFPLLRTHCKDVAEGMNYLSQLKVT
jgi:hypothetical protein